MRKTIILIVLATVAVMGTIFVVENLQQKLKSRLILEPTSMKIMVDFGEQNPNDCIQVMFSDGQLASIYGSCVFDVPVESLFVQSTHNIDDMKLKKRLLREIKVAFLRTALKYTEEKYKKNPSIFLDLVQDEIAYGQYKRYSHLNVTTDSITLLGASFMQYNNIEVCRLAITHIEFEKVEWIGNM